MKNYYGVMTEIHDHGMILVLPLYTGEKRECKPEDTLESHRCGITIYKDWYKTEEEQRAALERRKESVKQIAGEGIKRICA